MQQTQTTEEQTERLVLSTLTVPERKARLREIARTQSVLDGVQDAPMIEMVLDVLREQKKPRWKERRWAMGRLVESHLTPEQRDEVIALLIKTAETNSFLNRFALRSGIIWTTGLMGVISAGMISQFYREILTTNPLFMLFVTVMIAIGFSPLLMLWFFGIYAFQTRRGSRVRLAALKALAEMKAVEGVGLLLSAAKVASLREKLDAPLFALLSDLTPMHYGTLSTEAVPSLCEWIAQEHRQLDTSSPDARVFALLHALGKVGDGRALPFITKLMQTGKTSGVRIQASHLIPILEERKRLEGEFGMLLRHSSVPVNAKTDLLRAANAHADTHPETLVRPVNTPLE